MITKELIKEGIRENLVKFVVDPNMESGTVCQIGDSWFYFGGMTAEEINPSEYLRDMSEDDIVEVFFPPWRISEKISMLRMSMIIMKQFF